MKLFTDLFTAVNNFRKEFSCRDLRRWGRNPIVGASLVNWTIENIGLKFRSRSGSERTEGSSSVFSLLTNERVFFARPPGRLYALGPYQNQGSQISPASNARLMPEAERRGRSIKYFARVAALFHSSLGFGEKGVRGL